jgi:hypothetical protein
MHLHNKVMLEKYSAEEDGRIHSGEAGGNVLNQLECI